LRGQSGDVIEVGAILVEFDGVMGQSSAPVAAVSVTEAQPVVEQTAHASGSTALNDVFKLPDLGEGLPDAEIVRWLVKEGDVLALDQPMVEMETAKAVVEVPSPFAAKVAKLHGLAGDVIEVGAVLVSFGDGATEAAVKEITVKDDSPADAGTVVGSVVVGNTLVVESASAVVKALAKKLKVDLTQVKGSGVDGAISQADVKRAKKEGKLLGNDILGASPESTAAVSNDDNPLDFKASPAVRAYAHRLGIALSTCHPSGKKGSITKSDVDEAVSRPTSSVSASAAKSAPLAGGGLPTIQVSVEPQSVRGVRRAMAMGMMKTNAVVVPTTLMEDADITSWPKQDSLARYVRALVFAAKIEPALNCWFDGEKFERLVHPNVHVGIAIDSPDGLYVPVIHDADSKDASQVRARVQDLRQMIETKSLKQNDQQGATITLSNFGSIAGRYGTPVVSTPQVAILGTGRFRNELKLTAKGIENRKMLPLSLTFDHRACTGGEAARFLAAVIEDLQKSV